MSLLHPHLSDAEIDLLYQARSTRVAYSDQIERRAEERRIADRRTMELIAECRRRGVNVDGW